MAEEDDKGGGGGGGGSGDRRRMRRHACVWHTPNRGDAMVMMIGAAAEMARVSDDRERIRSLKSFGVCRRIWDRRRYGSVCRMSGHWGTVGDVGVRAKWRERERERFV